MFMSKKILREKVILGITIVVIVIVVLATIVVMISKEKSRKKAVKESHCAVSIKVLSAQESSMFPWVKKGRLVREIWNYYQCHQVRRNDIVLVRSANNKKPLVKVVKAVSGDKFHLQKIGQWWQILIYQEILRDSNGAPYLIDNKRYKKLVLYEKKYNGVIPKDTYLVSGDTLSGSFSLDSVEFEMVKKDNILGKIEVNYLASPHLMTSPNSGK